MEGNNMKKLFYLLIILLGLVVAVATGYFYFDYGNITILKVKESFPFSSHFLFLFGLGCLGGFIFLKYLYKFFKLYW